MGRGRGKGKKFTVTSHDEPGSGDEEKIPAQKRRGRPQKLTIDEIDEDIEKIEEEEESENGLPSKEMKSLSASDNGKKRRRNAQIKDKPDSVKEEDSNGTRSRSSTDDLTKPNGFRHNGSRRKSTPRRAAEAGVECRLFLFLILFVAGPWIQLVENELPEKVERLVRCEASAYQKLLMKRVEEKLSAFETAKVSNDG